MPAFRLLRCLPLICLLWYTLRCRRSMLPGVFVSISSQPASVYAQSLVDMQYLLIPSSLFFLFFPDFFHVCYFLTPSNWQEVRIQLLTNHSLTHYINSCRWRKYCPIVDRRLKSNYSLSARLHDILIRVTHCNICQQLTGGSNPITI